MTSIEWTGKTWNPIVGCSVVSPGCTNCYAMKEAYRFGFNDKLPQYRGLTEMTKGGAVWTGKVALHETALTGTSSPLHRRKPTTYFVNSMGDLFHEDVPDHWIDRVFAIMAMCPQHTFQVLTKRADFMRDYVNTAQDRVMTLVCDDVCDNEREMALSAMPETDEQAATFDLPVIKLHQWPLPNVWLGVSAEDQPRADQRIPDLLATPAAIRFVSLEPLLGPARLDSISTMQIPGAERVDALDGFAYGMFDEIAAQSLPKLDWVIVGGESGKGARPMHPDWARSIRDQCAEAGVPFFFKQWGEWAPIYDRDKDDPDWRRCDTISRRTPKGRWLNLEGGYGFHGDRVIRMDRLGKKAAGNLLDGRQHLEMPSHPIKGT